jgi:hypothetical protein
MSWDNGTLTQKRFAENEGEKGGVVVRIFKGDEMELVSAGVLPPNSVKFRLVKRCNHNSNTNTFLIAALLARRLLKSTTSSASGTTSGTRTACKRGTTSTTTRGFALLEEETYF